jgi:hypothetical protein
VGKNEIVLKYFWFVNVNPMGTTLCNLVKLGVLGKPNYINYINKVMGNQGFSEDKE